jgi:hypothetical protein
MPRRSRSRRDDALARLNAHVDRVAGGPCIALRLTDTEGQPSMLIMGDSCHACTTFKAAIAANQPAQPKPVALNDDEAADAEEGEL